MDCRQIAPSYPLLSQLVNGLNAALLVGAWLVSIVYYVKALQPIFGRTRVEADIVSKLLSQLPSTYDVESVMRRAYLQTQGGRGRGKKGGKGRRNRIAPAPPGYPPRAPGTASKLGPTPGRASAYAADAAGPSVASPLGSGDGAGGGYLTPPPPGLPPGFDLNAIVQQAVLAALTAQKQQQQSQARTGAPF